MYIASISDNGVDSPVFVDPHRGVLRPKNVVPDFHGDAMALLQYDLHAGLGRTGDAIDDDLFESIDSVQFTAPYRSPRKIWGIGLNYRDHAGDLDESVPEEPASFIKANHTIIGPDEAIVLPWQSNRVTAEAELGIIIGREAREISEDDALDYVWGICAVLDQTAEDILRRNPRFLTRSKNFPTFFSFGPYLVPLAEVLGPDRSLDQITVTTVVNGSDTRTNVVANMTYSPQFLVSFHSQMMPLYPGDIISSGTPGAIVVNDGDVAECRIAGVANLTNRVKRTA